MKEQTELQLTSNQLQLLKHSLGLDYVDQKKINTFKKTKDSYRNRFCAGESHDDYPNLKVLCDIGIMAHSEPQEMLAGDMYFYVTEKGINELIKFL